MELHRDPTYSTLELYYFRMSLFDHVDPEDLLLFVRNFNMTLAASVTLDTDAKVQYLCTLVRGEALRQLDWLSTDVEST